MKLLDILCQDWHFNIDNLEHIDITVLGKKYIRRIYNSSEKTYIFFKNEKYYFDFPE